MSNYERVWQRMAVEHPEFTHAYDPFDDPNAIECLILSNYIGFKPFPSARCMDIGANVGLVSAFWALNDCDVTAYEADPLTYEIQTEMFARTGLKVNAINAAVYSYDGEIPFLGAKTPGAQCRNGAVQIAGGLGDGQLDAPKAKCVSLATAIGNLEWDAVKFDIEGAEFETLLKTDESVLRRINFIQIEFHHGWATKEIYDEVMSKLNRVFAIEGREDGDPNSSSYGRYHWIQGTQRVD
jgi:FkbM family methyltransferase